MPAPKRRRFEIRQRQKRKFDNRKVRLAMNTERDLLDTARKNLGQRIKIAYSANTPPTTAEFESLRQQVSSWDSAITSFFAKTAKYERALGKRAIQMRHDFKIPVQTMARLLKELEEKHGVKIRL